MNIGCDPRTKESSQSSWQRCNRFGDKCKHCSPVDRAAHRRSPRIPAKRFLSWQEPVKVNSSPPGWRAERRRDGGNDQMAGEELPDRGRDRSSDGTGTLEGPAPLRGLLCARPGRGHHILFSSVLPSLSPVRAPLLCSSGDIRSYDLLIPPSCPPQHRLRPARRPQRMKPLSQFRGISRQFHFSPSLLASLSPGLRSSALSSP